jgi:outer membrane murein-binding lipoprotein Lpp
MSWHDPARALEPESDTALRNELRGLLGLPEPETSYFEAEPTPELIALADDLRREALRRNHTARRKTSWMLLAAALPFALALGGVGVWGVGQKHKADQLASAVAHQEAEIQQLAAAQQHQAPAAAAAQALPAHVPAAKGQPSQVLLMGRTAPRNKAKELVIPVQRSPEPTANDTERVKAR